MEEKNVIILNKCFEGAWNENEGNISHEIIDFVLTDKDEHFIYNTPYGVCPDYIYVGEKKNNEEKKKKDKETHQATYLLLTGKANMKNKKSKLPKNNSIFPINYCIELEEKIHSYNKPDNEDELNKNRKDVEEICQQNNIKYGEKYLHEIYKNDKSLLVTFKAKKMWKAKTPIIVDLDYKFQRNKGYIKSDENKKDYEELIKQINDNDNWEDFNLTNIDIDKQQNIVEKNFLDLILKVDSEECYTNILYSVLKHSNLMTKFCEKFKKTELVNEEKFNVFREYSVAGGRMDVCAESENHQQRVVIENKVFSGLNGIHKDDSSQLDKYYEWATKEPYKSPLCFVVAPDHRIEDLKKETTQEMLKHYEFVGYSEIVNFLKENLTELENEDYEFNKYAKDFISVFSHHAHKSKQEYFENLFLSAIQESNK